MIRVLVVDDQPLVADAHRALVDRVRGFTTIGTALDGRAALAVIRRGTVDLVLLDLSMPRMDGWEFFRELQKVPGAPDVIVISAARNLDSVRGAVRSGAVHYLIKPFTFAALRQKLEHYAQYRSVAEQDREVTDQGEIDLALAALRDPGDSTLPKGLSRETLALVRHALQEAAEGTTALEVACRVGASRVTVRRYLEHLVDVGSCERLPVHGKAGRPELVYRLRQQETRADPPR